MSPYLVKSIFAVALVIVGTAAFASQMARMGIPDRQGDPEKLKKFHRTMGWLFVILLLALIYQGARFWVAAGDSLSIRAAFHIVLALGLIVMVLLKVLVVRTYRGFLRMAPAQGMAIFALMLIVFTLSAVFTGLMLVAK